MTYEVHTYAGNCSGARASAFKVGNVSVCVTPMFAEENEAAFELACRLARSDDETSRLTAERDAYKERVIVQQAPPSKLLGTGYVRFHDGAIYLLNRRARGFGEFGYRCDSWDDLFRRFDVYVTGHGEDEHGAWWSVESTRGGAL